MPKGGWVEWGALEIGRFDFVEDRRDLVVQVMPDRSIEIFKFSTLSGETDRILTIKDIDSAQNLARLLHRACQMVRARLPDDDVTPPVK